MQILANLPVFLRKPMLLNRLKDFYAMSDNDKRETINMALSAAPTIDPNKLSALFRTWLEILSEFDTEKRAIMFQTYCKQILENTRLIEKLEQKRDDGDWIARVSEDPEEYRSEPLLHRSPTPSLQS